MNCLIIIPARGGSKGIPRKNLRILNGYPLIYYVIKTSLNSKYNPDVYVSSDDQEILTLSRKFGAEIHHRDPSLSDSVTTLDPVIINAYEEIKNQTNKTYDLVITIQPTSPLLSVKTLDDAISYFQEKRDLDTLISAIDDTHLTWTLKNGSFKPTYKKRVNRQYLQPVFRETGAFLISKPQNFEHNSRIGKNVDLYIIPSNEKIDVDDFEDWSICEFYLKRKKILFVVTGNNKVGLGHVYNTLAIADEILDHQIYFLVDIHSELAFAKIRSSNHSVYIQKEENIIKDIEKLQPDVIINDILDTSKEYIESLRQISKYIINFEDLGEGTRKADLVINAMYPEKDKFNNHYYGHEYFILRNEFQYSPPVKRINKNVKQVIITFGGVDPNDFTHMVLKEIYDYCLEKDIKIVAVLGLGYQNEASLKKFEEAEIYRNVSNLSDLIHESDICFTSAGRTTFEIASIGTPAIILCQNEREKSHFFASDEYGFINLGSKDELKDRIIYDTFVDLAQDQNHREKLSKKMLSFKLRKGKTRVINLIRDKIK